MLTVDFHTHSIASHHAMNTIDEMLRYADRYGIQGLAITDHGPGTDNAVQIAKNPEEIYHLSNRISGPDSHFFNVFVSRYQPPEDIKTCLFKGIECNILGKGNLIVDLPLKYIADFDVVIASVHPIPHIFSIESPQHVVDRVLTAIEQPIDIIGHPFHKVYPAGMEEIVKAAAEKGITLELNNSSLRLKKAESQTLCKMLELVKRYQGRISLSSDAHAANEIGGDESLIPVLKETSFPSELIVNYTLESALRFVEERKKRRAEMKAQIKKG